MYIANEGSDVGKWNDYPCDNDPGQIANYVCKQSMVESRSSALSWIIGILVVIVILSFMYYYYSKYYIINYK